MTAMGMMLATLAHEVNNPNNTIMFNLRRFTRTWNDILPILDEFFEQRGDFKLGGLAFSRVRTLFPELLAGTMESSEIIKAIIENLKHFVRQSTDAMDFNIEVNDVIKRAVFLMESQVTEGMGRLEVLLGEELPKIKGNPQKLIQVMVNLISNALEALDEADQMVTVHSGVEVGGENIFIKVKDEGKGMTAEECRQAEEAFFTTRHKSGGTGLGLTITRSLVDDHGGDLKIDSKPGQGTTVSVRLPVTHKS
jgi:signal transduction histidine kinase